MRTRKLTVVALAAALGLGTTLPAATARTPDEAPAAARPNIVFVLVDDLSANLVPYMRTLTGLRTQGTAFSNYFVADSLCCPSRATILTGELPHNTGVRTNTSQNGDGGWPVFRNRGHENRTYAVALDNADYRTGYLGKYMNEYQFGPEYQPPAGWDEWHVADNGGYNHFNYRITRFIKDATGGPIRTIDRMQRNPDNPDQTYITDVLKRRAINFIDRSGSQPFFLQISPFAPHSGGVAGEPHFPPAMRDRPGGEFPNGDCGPARCDQIRAPRTAAFDEDTTDKPGWVRREPLTAAEKTTIDRHFRNRVRMVQSVDDMIAGVLASLTEAQRANTYFVFSTDNGFHLGQHRLLQGKSTAYDHDVRTPLIVTGPGVVHQTVGKLAQNIDLYPTFLRMGGVVPQGRDGHGLLALLQGTDVTPWRQSALVEHGRQLASAADPDRVLAAGNATPPAYRAIRTSSSLLVRYGAGNFEYYDLVADPNQLTNRPNAAPARLKAELERLDACGRAGQRGCWEESLQVE